MAKPPNGAVVIDLAFEAEARAMVRAMETGELPPKSAPYYDRVKKLNDMHWAEQEKRAEKKRHGDQS